MLNCCGVCPRDLMVNPHAKARWEYLGASIIDPRLWERGKDGSVRNDFHKEAMVSTWDFITLINHAWLSVSTV